MWRILKLEFIYIYFFFGNYDQWQSHRPMYIGWPGDPQNMTKMSPTVSPSLSMSEWHSVRAWVPKPHTHQLLIAEVAYWGKNTQNSTFL